MLWQQLDIVQHPQLPAPRWLVWLERLGQVQQELRRRQEVPLPLVQQPEPTVGRQVVLWFDVELHELQQPPLPDPLPSVRLERLHRLHPLVRWRQSVQDPQGHDVEQVRWQRMPVPEVHPQLRQRPVPYSLPHFRLLQLERLHQVVWQGLAEAQPLHHQNARQRWLHVPIPQGNPQLQHLCVPRRRPGDWLEVVVHMHQDLRRWQPGTQARCAGVAAVRWRQAPAPF